MTNTKKINLKKESSKNYSTGDIFQTNIIDGEFGLTQQNIILVYYIFVGGLSPDQAENTIANFIVDYKIDNIHIHQIFMASLDPLKIGVECIYR